MTVKSEAKGETGVRAIGKIRDLNFHYSKRNLSSQLGRAVDKYLSRQ